jgi:hypothetical protein
MARKLFKDPVCSDKVDIVASGPDMYSPQRWTAARAKRKLLKRLRQA